MGASDRERAERHALGLLRTLAKRHRDDLARLSRAEDVWTALAEPLTEARARFERERRTGVEGVFERAVYKVLMTKVARRLELERAEADEHAVRVDVGYREAVEARPAPTPEPEKRKLRKSEPRPAEDVEQREARRVGTMFLGIGLVAAVCMTALGGVLAWKDRHARRVRTEFVAQTCTMTKSVDAPAKGGMTQHVVEFEHFVEGRRFVHDQYSPDVPHGPGAQWFPKGPVSCVCDPKDPSVCYLHAGNQKREPIPWLYLVLFPAFWLCIGTWMRVTKSLGE